MKILQVSTEDLGGVAIALQRAISRHTPHEARAIRRRDNGLRYPGDITSQDDEVWQEWFEWADVIHIHEYTDLWLQAQQWCPSKPVLWMLHGSFYRANVEKVNQLLDEHRLQSVVSTVDLLQHQPRASWLPKPLDIRALAKLRQPAKGFRLVQARTSPIKGTPERLLPDIECDIIQGVPHEEALARIGAATVLFGKFPGPAKTLGKLVNMPAGVGVASNEAMAMGIPVLSGGTDEGLARLRREWGELPFFPTTPEELPAHVALFRDDEWLRDFWGRRGKEHVLKHHDEAKVAARVVALYEGL